ncbi:glycerol-3-phosphate 1-O-acyltransferase PlsY [Thermophilibacter mediterraneus]|uniref:glycerol-3-phosphate 1-O-acyltransferase PlsY n=1 Tax=Thermophilibacter mediterraneus TaxID=1871031 RepID=UPI000930DA25|nr:glycerol-3-phosphate 1-O-acyltransferase PlsY [Thermophilibacter mediterraneus]
MLSLEALTALLTLLAYLVCGIPFGLVVARAMGHIDVRTTGSGNIGTTNVARSVGKGAAALTLLLDLGKGLVCMLVSRLVLALALFGGDFASLDHTTAFGASLSVVFLGCILGHVFSPYLRLHGGKGIAVGFGAALGLYWPIGVGLLALFLVLVIPTRYVSLGSVAAAASLPLWCVLFGFPAISVAPIAVAAVVVIWSHRENVRRLVRGEERRFSFHKGGRDEREGDGAEVSGS